MASTTQRPLRAAAAAVLTFAALAAAAVVLLGGGPAALAQAHGPAAHRGASPADHLAEMARELGLSGAQKAAAEKLHRDAAAKAAPLREQARVQHEEIAAMLEAGKPDPKALGSRMIEMHATHVKLRAVHEQLRASVEAQLTAAQRAKLDQLHAKHGDPAEHGPGPGMHPPCVGAPGW
jgi:Spy/CpxP family protein refolding chaperone